MVLAASGELDEAMEAWRRALAMNQKVFDPGHPALANALDGIGMCLVERARPAEAIPVLERALAIRVAHSSSPEQISETRYNLARALWETKLDRKRALELAAKSRDGFAAAGSSARTAAQWAVPAVPKAARLDWQRSSGNIRLQAFLPNPWSS